VSDRARTFALGEEVVIVLGFEYEGDRELETVEAVFVREGSGKELVFLGDARKETSTGQTIHYTARLKAEIDPNTDSGEYRCARLSARDRFDDDWDFADIGRLDLVVRVERSPHRLEVTRSEFL
jgi:hypothetical protein